jgi:hypothetical protein
MLARLIVGFIVVLLMIAIFSFIILAGKWVFDNLALTDNLVRIGLILYGIFGVGMLMYVSYQTGKDIIG